MLNLNLYERTLTSSPGALIIDLAPRTLSYEQSIVDQGGFESAAITLRTTLPGAAALMGRLFCPLIVYGADSDVAWEGYLASVGFSVGGTQINVGLDRMANSVRVRYTLRGLGTPQTPITATNASSIATYGTRQVVVSAGAPTDSTAATALANAVLAERAWPLTQASSTIAASGADEAITVTLNFAGWYTTLDWVTLERTDTSTESTTTQVGVLIGTSAPGIGATNPFLNTSTARIDASGVNDTRQVDADTTYRSKIEALLAKGTSVNQRLTWGVYEGRQFVATTWAGATTATVTYRTQFGSAIIRDTNFQAVRPWRVRPNAIVERSELLDLITGGGVDTGARSYVARVTYRRDENGDAVTLEGSDQRSTDALLARMGG